MSFGTAKRCVITDVYETVLFEEEHLLRLDEIACLEAGLEHHSYEQLNPRCFDGDITRRIIYIRQSQ